MTGATSGGNLVDSYELFAISHDGSVKRCESPFVKTPFFGDELRLESATGGLLKLLICLIP